LAVLARKEVAALREKAGDVAQLLKLLANEQRLLILCRLAMDREVSVGEIAEAVELGQSALSQHLAKMREEGLIAARKEGLNVFYRIADSNLSKLLGTLKSIYCP
jgi:DNA-binding transcriptional ArsR family regulator